jgi:hypothetical protein
VLQLELWPGPRGVVLQRDFKRTGRQRAQTSNTSVTHWSLDDQTDKTGPAQLIPAATHYWRKEAHARQRPILCAKQDQQCPIGLGMLGSSAAGQSRCMCAPRGGGGGLQFIVSPCSKHALHQRLNRPAPTAPSIKSRHYTPTTRWVWHSARPACFVMPPHQQPQGPSSAAPTARPGRPLPSRRSCSAAHKTCRRPPL